MFILMNFIKNIITTLMFINKKIKMKITLKFKIILLIFLF